VRLARVAVLLVAIGVPVDAAEPLDPVLYSEIQRLAAMLTDGFATLDQADAYRFGPKAALSVLPAFFCTRGYPPQDCPGQPLAIGMEGLARM